MTKRHEFYLNIPEFQGPIDLLLSLIHEKEIQAENISLISILEQYLDLSLDDIDLGSEFIGAASSLLLLKSRSLLPDDEEIQEDERASSMNKQEAIKALIEYVQFKKAGEELCFKDRELSSMFTRGVTGTCEKPKPLGLEHISLDDLSMLFKELIAKKGSPHVIFEEVWRVSDKISYIKREIAENKNLSFYSLFLENQSKEEWIVTFLAILELMKLGVIQAKKEESDIIITGMSYDKGN